MARLDDRDVILNTGAGMVLQALLRRAQGFAALWVFDIDEEREFISQLVVRLTADEAQRVADADPYSVGFLEPVRATLVDREAHVLITGFGGEVLGSLPVYVRPDGDEGAFVADLDGAASTLYETGEIDGRDDVVEVLREARELQGV